MNNLHEHNTELYEQVQKYIHNQNAENAVALVEWCQREGGKFTGYYPTNYVTQEDFETATMNKDDNKTARKLSHEDMKSLADQIGDGDTEYGMYWDAIREWNEENK